MASARAAGKDALVRKADEDDLLCDVLSAGEFVREVTELLIERTPELTGAQISRLRCGLLIFVQRYGWVEG